MKTIHKPTHEKDMNRPYTLNLFLLFFASQNALTNPSPCCLYCSPQRKQDLPCLYIPVKDAEHEQGKPAKEQDHSERDPVCLYTILCVEELRAEIGCSQTDWQEQKGGFR